MEYNIYYGTIGKTLGIKYRYTKNFKNEQEAIRTAKNEATSLYYKNEGKCGIPTFSQIAKEAELTNIPIESLYNAHIEDMTRYFVVPTELDTIPSKNIRR